MKIIILTVNKKGKETYERLKKKHINHDIIIKKFPLICKNYGTDFGQETSDTSSCVKKSIWDNTLECIKYGLQYDDCVCVIQDDFIPYDNINDNIINSLNFIKQNKDTDILFLSSHPCSVYTYTNYPNIAKVKKCNGWQSVIFTKSFLDKVNKYKINVPFEIHSDIYFNQYYKDKINAFIHIPASGRQATDLFMRKITYGFLFKLRYNYQYGDPFFLLLLVVVFVIIFYIIQVLKNKN